MSNKTIDIMIYDAEVRLNKWMDIAEDVIALRDRDISSLSAMGSVRYWEGKLDGLLAARDLLA
jgi:hypothetical protein